MTEPSTFLTTLASSPWRDRLRSGITTRPFAAGLLCGGVIVALVGGQTLLDMIVYGGGLALLGTLAYKSYHRYQQEKAAGASPDPLTVVQSVATGLATQCVAWCARTLQPPPPPPANAAHPELARAVVRAVIGAAAAEGRIAATAHPALLQRLDANGITTPEDAMLLQELAQPQDVGRIASVVATPEAAAQVYLAALLTSDSQGGAAQDYRTRLASALQLTPDFAAGLQEDTHGRPPQRQAA